MSRSIPRQVEKFWTGTDWEIFLGGDLGGTANQHRKFGKFRKFMGGTGSKLGWDRFPKIFLGGPSLVILGVLPRYGKWVFEYRTETKLFSTIFSLSQFRQIFVRFAML